MADLVLVLVVDDEVLVQGTLQDALEDGGFAVATALDAPEAIARLEAKDDPIHALVTDINLGGKLTGWDVARRAREITPAIPVVYMTGFADDEWTANGVPNSILLHKPFATAQLLTAVSHLLNLGGPATYSPG